MKIVLYLINTKREINGRDEVARGGDGERADGVY